MTSAVDPLVADQDVRPAAEDLERELLVAAAAEQAEQLVERPRAGRGNAAGPPRRNQMWGASGSSALTIARKSSNECIGYRSHVAGPERHQHVAGFEMPVQLRDRVVEAGRPQRPDPGRGQRLASARPGPGRSAVADGRPRR